MLLLVWKRHGSAIAVCDDHRADADKLPRTVTAKMAYDFALYRVGGMNSLRAGAMHFASTLGNEA